MPPKIEPIQSASQLIALLEASKIVVIEFYTDTDELSRSIKPLFTALCLRLTRPQKVTFAKVNAETQQELTQSYGITSIPTIVVFKRGAKVETIKDADAGKLHQAVQKLVAEADSDGSVGGFGESQAESSGGAMWLGTAPPKGYGDITDQVDLKGLDLLNADSAFGGARGLFDGGKPSSLSSGKAKAEGQESKDWVESDTDEQLMLFMPFQSSLRIHTLQITSLPPTTEDEDDIPMRPRTLQIFSNRAHVLGFDEAEGIPATQSITLSPADWDPETGTAKVELRFVKFQNVTSLVLFIVDGEGEGEKVRIDRLRLIGESGEKRDMGKLEKIGEGGGE